MKKICIFVLPLILALVVPLSYAQDTASNDNSAAVQRMMRAHYGPTGGGSGMYPPDMSKEKIEKFMHILIELGLLYKMLEQPTMVPVDGGIIVAYGNTLRKYDKDLNVIKEVQMDVNVDGMQELASKFAKKYSADVMDLMGGSEGFPDLLRAKMTSNDALAKATLRAISTASESYAMANNGNYPANETVLTGATPPYLNTGYCANSPIAGYVYDCTGMSTSGYTISATPVTIGSTGTTTFTITTGGILAP